MINFEKFELDNGLKIIVHQDKMSPMVAFNILYKVGAKNENPERTGFAHLFEHLMFEGSVNISDYDTHMQAAGGDNNAFTNNDYTNYYLTIPKQNIETAFWLESDRMLQLDFSEEKLNIQKGVVIEEYNQRYLNRPYGDAMLLMRSLAYRKHPYKWPTIGKGTIDIEYASLQDVKDFFYHFYAPNNAILSIAGDVDINEIKALANKWFGPIPRREIRKEPIPIEPEQEVSQILEFNCEHPENALYIAYHMCGRLNDEYFTCDMISDILSLGDSSRFEQRLIKERQLFTYIDAHISGSIDPGLFMIIGRLNDNVTFKEAEAAIQEELDILCNEYIEDRELTKLKNKMEIQKLTSEIDIIERAMVLAYYEMLGDASKVNTDFKKYLAVTKEMIQKTAKQLFAPNNRSVIRYKKAQNN